MLLASSTQTASLQNVSLQLLRSIQNVLFYVGIWQIEHYFCVPISSTVTTHGWFSKRLVNFTECARPFKHDWSQDNRSSAAALSIDPIAEHTYNLD